MSDYADLPERVIIAVLDTNVLASGMLGLPREHSVPGELMRRWLIGQFELIISEFILDELEHHAFASSYFRSRMTVQEMSQLLSRLRSEARLVEITVEVRSVAPDPDDDQILATAASARADYLITGDQQLRDLDGFGATRIRTPREFLTTLEGGPVSEGES